MKLSLILSAFACLIILGLTLTSAYGTNSPAVFGHSAGELDFTGMINNITTSGDIVGTRVCIGTDCRTSWPTLSSTIINSTVIINNASFLNLTTLSSNNFIINGTVFLNGTLVLNNTGGTVIVLNSTSIINNTIFTTNNIDNTQTIYQVTNNTFYVPNPINLNSINGNVVASGDIQGNRLCIGTDCRSSWPTGNGNANGGANIIFQAQKFIDEDTNYYIDLNTGANIAGNWVLDGQFRANSVCIGTDCRTSWPTTTETVTHEYASGMWCGRGQIGNSYGYDQASGPNANCLGQDPSYSCPNGFTRTNFAINSRQNAQTEFYWTCIKN